LLKRQDELFQFSIGPCAESYWQTYTINIAKQSKNMPEEISNLNSRKIMYNIQLKIYLKHLTVKKELQRMQKIEKNT